MFRNSKKNIKRVVGLLLGSAAVYAYNCTSLPSYTSKTYIAGEKVIKNARVYECKPYPYTGWCGVDVYSPQLNDGIWTQAWNYLGACDAAVPTTYYCNQISNYVSNSSYTAGNLVKYGTIVFECKGSPFTGWCSMSTYEPGTGANWSQAWNQVGNCIGSTSSSSGVSSSIAISSSAPLSSVNAVSSALISSSSKSVSSGVATSYGSTQLNQLIKNNAPLAGQSSVYKIPVGIYQNPNVKVNSGVQVRYQR